MHTVDLLEAALSVADRLGYRLRQDWLDGSGGACQLSGQKWLFLDLAESPTEQLGMVLDALRADPDLASTELPAELEPLLRLRKSA